MDNRKITEVLQKAKTRYIQRVCAYVRVSTDNTAQLASLENQTQYYERIIKANPTYEYCGIFSDAGISGANEKRPGFQAMLEKARKGEIDIIITKSISRFARNTVLLLKSIRELKSLGVAVVFEEQYINTLSGQGEMLLTLLASIAEEERKSVSENVRWRKRKDFEKGKSFINTNSLLGYIKDDNGNIIVDKAQSKVVRKIFRLYISGMSAKAIARKLNDDKVPTYLDNEGWNYYRILKIISNEKYIGDCRFQKYYIAEDGKEKKNRGELPQFYIKNHHEGIVSRRDFEQAQKLREEHKSPTYPYTSKLICPFCGDKLCHNKSNGKGEFVCKTQLYQTSSVCPGMRIPDEVLERYELLPITEPLVVEEVDYVQNSKKRRLKKSFRFIPVSQYIRE